MKTDINGETTREMNTFFLNEVYLLSKKNKRFSKKIGVYFFLSIFSFSLFFILREIPQYLFEFGVIANIILFICTTVKTILLMTKSYKKMAFLNFEYEVQKCLKMDNPKNKDTIKNFLAFDEIIYNSNYNTSTLLHSNRSFLNSMLNQENFREKDSNANLLVDIYDNVMRSLFKKIHSNMEENKTVSDIKNEVVRNLIFHSNKK